MVLNINWAREACSYATQIPTSDSHKPHAGRVSASVRQGAPRVAYLCSPSHWLLTTKQGSQFTKILDTKHLDTLSTYYIAAASIINNKWVGEGHFYESVQYLSTYTFKNTYSYHWYYEKYNILKPTDFIQSP